MGFSKYTEDIQDRYHESHPKRNSGSPRTARIHGVRGPGAQVITGGFGDHLLGRCPHYGLQLKLNEFATHCRKVHKRIVGHIDYLRATIGLGCDRPTQESIRVRPNVARPTVACEVCGARIRKTRLAKHKRKVHGVSASPPQSGPAD